MTQGLSFACKTEQLILQIGCCSYHIRFNLLKESGKGASYCSVLSLLNRPVKPDTNRKFVACLSFMAYGTESGIWY